MSGERWIVVRNWERFQHYADRNPPWIKNYVELLHSDAYLGLSFHARGVLHGLWIEYAAARGQLRGDTATLTRRLSRQPHDRVTTATLEALKEAGFIEFSASKPLALTRARARSREAEGEEDSPPTPPRKRVGGMKELVGPLRRFTGCRALRGSHGITHVRDPLGVDPPPFGWPHPKPTREEIRAAMFRNGSVDPPGSLRTTTEPRL